MEDKPSSEKKESWREKYTPKDYKSNQVEAMLQSGTLQALQNVMPGVDLRSEALSGRMSPLELLKQQKKLVEFGNLKPIEGNDSVNNESHRSNEPLIQQEQKPITLQKEDHALIQQTEQQDSPQIQQNKKEQPLQNTQNLDKQIQALNNNTSKKTPRSKVTPIEDKKGAFAKSMQKQKEKKMSASRKKRRKVLKGHTSLLLINSCAEKLDGCANAYTRSFGNPKKNEDNDIDKWFNSNCGFRGKSLCSVGRIFLFVIYLAVLLLYVYLTKDGIQLSRIKKLPKKKFIAERLVLGAVIMTVYGFITVQIQNTIFWVCLFFLQFVPSTYKFLEFTKQYSSFSEMEHLLLKDFDAYQGMWRWGFTALIYLLFWLLATIKTDIKSGFGRKHGRIFIILAFIIGPFAMIGMSLYTTLVSKKVDIYLYHELVVLMAPPMIMILVLAWIYFHFRFLNVPPLHIQKRLEDMKKNQFNEEQTNDRIGQAILKAKLQNQQNKQKKKDAKSGKDKMFSFFQRISAKLVKNSVNYNSFVIGVIMIVVCTYILQNGILKELESGSINNQQSFNFSLIMFFLIPIFVLIGIGIITTNSDKSFFSSALNSPIIYLLGTIVLSGFINEKMEKEQPTIVSIIIYGPLISLIFWSTLKHIGFKIQETVYYLVSYFIIFYFLPEFVFSPYTNWNWHSFDIDPLLEFLSLGKAFIILSAILAYFVYSLEYFPENPLIDQHKAEQSAQKLDIQNLRLWDYSEIGRWFNKTCLMIVLSLQIYVLRKRPEQATDEQMGMVFAFTLVAFQLYMTCNINIGATIITRKKVMDKTKTLSAFIESNLENIHEVKRSQISRIKAALLLLSVLIFFQVVCPFLLDLLIANAHHFDDQSSQLLSNVEFMDWVYFYYTEVGSIVVSVFCIILYWSRTKQVENAKSSVPLMVILFWVFFYIPFCALLPSYFIQSNGNLEEVSRFQRIMTSIVLFIALLLLASLAIYFNLRLLKNDQIRKMFFITESVKRDLSFIAVKTDSECVHLVYKQFLNKDIRILKEQLKNKNPICCWKIPKTCDDTDFSKIIVTRTAFDILNVKGGDFPVQKVEKVNKLIPKEGCCMKCIKMILADPLTILRKGENLEDSIISEEEEDFNRDETESESQEEPLKPDPHAKRKLKWLEFRYYPLPQFIWDYLKYCDMNNRILVEEAEQKIFFKMIFDDFAFGSDLFEDSWMDYFWVKEFLKIHYIVPSADISDEEIDILYCQFVNPKIRRSGRKKLKQDPIVWHKKLPEGKEPEIQTEFGHDWKGDTSFRFIHFLTEVAKKKFQLADAKTALNQLIRENLFPLGLWNLKETKLHYTWTWKMVKYLLRMKFPDNPDYSWAFDKVVLTEESDTGLPQEPGDTPEPSSDELSEYEYDVLLYLKEDKERRKKDVQQKKISCIRFYLQKIIKFVKFVYTFFYGLLTLLPNYICHVPKPSSKDLAFKKEPLVGKDDVMKYLKKGEKGEQNYEHNKSPPWSIIINVMLDSMAVADRKWSDQKVKNSNPILSFDSLNITALVFKFLEYYSLASFAFKPEALWNHSQFVEIFTGLFNSNLPLDNSYEICFWAAVVMSAIYLVFTVLNSQQQEKGKLGQDEKGKPARFPSWVWLRCMMINLLGQVFTIFILSTFLDAFLCDIELEPQVLYKVRTLECYSSQHQTYMIVGGIAGLIYYLLVSFTFPNMQRDQAGLVLKYDSLYIVVLTQAKLLIAGLGSFFPDIGDVTTQLILQAIILVILAVYVKKAYPCSIYSFNIVETGFFYLAAWACISSTVLHITESTTIGLICLLFGVIVIGTFIFINYKRAKLAEKECEHIYTLWTTKNKEMRREIIQQQSDEHGAKEMLRRQKLEGLRVKYDEYNGLVKKKEKQTKLKVVKRKKTFKKKKSKDGYSKLEDLARSNKVIKDGILKKRRKKKKKKKKKKLIKIKANQEDDLDLMAEINDIGKDKSPRNKVKLAPIKGRDSANNTPQMGHLKLKKKPKQDLV